MRVGKSRCSPWQIDGGNAARTPTNFAEIVRDDFPLFHESQTLVGVLNRLRRRFVQLTVCVARIRASNRYLTFRSPPGLPLAREIITENLENFSKLGPAVSVE